MTVGRISEQADKPPALQRDFHTLSCRLTVTSERQPLHSTGRFNLAEEAGMSRSAGPTLVNQRELTHLNFFTDKTHLSSCSVRLLGSCWSRPTLPLPLWAPSSPPASCPQWRRRRRSTKTPRKTKTPPCPWAPLCSRLPKASLALSVSRPVHDRGGDCFVEHRSGCWRGCCLHL